MIAKKYKNQFYGLREELLSKFGAARLEETAFPVYFNKFPPAAYLGWSRVFKAQNLLSGVRARSVLDFGSGLGVMLPYLASYCEEVIALDLDPEITKFVIEKLDLKKIKVINNFSDCKSQNKFDIVVALDVLEHVENLNNVFQSLLTTTAANGVWIISGPTENSLYKIARRIANTTGEGHVRNIYDVFNSIPKNMICEKVYRLPWGIPLFLIGKFRKVD